MLKFFQPRPLIEQSGADWILATYEWALTYFDSEEFFCRSRLVQPSNDFFPGSVDSVHAKAENVFQSTRKYAGLSHWSMQLQAPEQFQNNPHPQLNLARIERNSAENLQALNAELPLYFSYNLQQTRKPEDLSASFAHLMAQHLVVQSKVTPPGGPDFFVEATEILAIFMGFGVMFANSAYTFRGGCGSCSNAQANRQAALSEDQVMYALALYCRLKGVQNKEATRFLKKHLRGSYKQALKQIEKQSEGFNKLMKFGAGSS